jgi:hypothetical protein
MSRKTQLKQVKQVGIGDMFRYAVRGEAGREWYLSISNALIRMANNENRGRKECREGR